MIVLASTTEVLRARLAAPITTANPTFSFAWGDDAATRALGNTRGALNGTTNVNLVDSPAASTARVVRAGYLYNADSADVALTIEHYDGTYARPLAAITLKSGYTLTLADDGFRVTDANGAEIEPGAAPSAGRVVIPFAFGDASPTPIFTAPAACTDILVRLVIDTPFNGTGAELKLGTSGSPESLLAAASNDPTQAAGYEAAPDVSLTSGTEIVLTITPGSGATQGSGRVIFDTI